MSGMTFGLHLAAVRNQGLSTAESWFLRQGEREKIRPFRICPLTPFENLTVDDVIWALDAAAMHPAVTHLELHFKHPQSSPAPQIDGLLRVREELSRLGFDVSDTEVDYLHQSTTHFCVRFSLFSTAEIVSYCGTA